MDNIFQYFHGNEIQDALAKKYRVYLCGDFEQGELECIRDKQLEIGMSYYREFTADKPHFHERATEYNFIIYGSVKIYLIDENQEYEFSKDSLFILPPNTKYASKNLTNTRVLFVKSPGGNDKKLIDTDDKLKNWLKIWD